VKEVGIARRPQTWLTHLTSRLFAHRTDARATRTHFLLTRAAANKGRLLATLEPHSDIAQKLPSAPLLLWQADNVFEGLFRALMDAAGGVADGAIAFVHAAAEVTGFPYTIVVWMHHVLDPRVRHVVIYNSSIGGFAELGKLKTIEVRSVMASIRFKRAYLLFGVKFSSIWVKLIEEQH